jgi:hypothetical protein
MNALGAAGRPARIHFRPRSIDLVIIETPFPDIARHVFNSKRTGSERKCADGRTFGIAIVNIAIAPGNTRQAVAPVQLDLALRARSYFDRPAIFSLPRCSAAASRWRNPALAGCPYSTFSLTKNFRIASTRPSMSWRRASMSILRP